jgi:nucleoid-associated protein YgaU
MKKIMRTTLSVTLASTLLLSQSVNVNAGWFDKVKDTVKEATDTVKETTEKAKDWTENAVDDAKDWTENAIDDATDWTKNAIDDVSDVLDDILKDNPNLSELDLLPVLTMDVNTATNVLSKETGTFTYGENVKSKKMPFEAEKKLKKALMDIGLTDYWSNFVIDEVAGTSGDINVGEYVADLLPYSFVYGDKVASAINSELEETALVDIDPYTDGILPSDDVDGMNFTYTIKSDKIKGTNLIVITGLKYGRRDDFTVTLKLGDTEIPTQKRALNKEEVAFVATVDNSANAEQLEVIYTNKFEKPADLAFEIADGIQDGINALVPFGNPISNGARDSIKDAINSLAYVTEETKKDKDGNVKTNKDGSEKKEVKEVSLNDVLGNGDAGVMITELIYKIPGLGSIIKPILKVSGGDDKLASIIRSVIGQTEVKSYAKLKNEGKIYIKTFDTVEAMNTEINNATTKSNVDINDYKKADSVEGTPVEDIDTGIVDTTEQNIDAAEEIVDNQNEEEKVEEKVMPTSLEIKRYDTIGNISLRYYGDYSMKEAICKANREYLKKTHDKLNVGDTLVLPEPAKFLPPVEDENTKVYVVKAGDTLAKIAKKFYKDAKAYNKIVEANKGLIKDVHKIFEGQVLAIPAK